MTRLAPSGTIAAGAAGLAVGTLGMLLTRSPATDGPTTDMTRTARAFELHATAPELDRDQVQALLEQSDRWTRALRNDSDQVDIQATLNLAWHDATPTDGQARDWYRQHRDLFAGRSYRASAATVDRLYRIEKVRAWLDDRAEQAKP